MGPWRKNASTSARCGAEKAPPRRVHFSAAAAEANCSAAVSPCFSVIAKASAPWNTSPAPSVSAAIDRKSRRMPQVLVFIEPQRALDAQRRRQECRGQLGDLLQRLGVVGNPSGRLERLAGEHQMRGRSQKSFAQRHGAVDINDDRDAAPPCLDAEIGTEFRATALDQDGAAVIRATGRHRAGGPSIVPDRGSSRWFARRRASIMMLEIALPGPACARESLGVDALPRELFEEYNAADVSPASPIGPQIEARAPSRASPIAALSAFPPQIWSKWVACSLEPRVGRPWHAKRQVPHRNADAEDTRAFLPRRWSSPARPSRFSCPLELEARC